MTLNYAHTFISLDKIKSHHKYNQVLSIDTHFTAQLSSPCYSELVEFTSAYCTRPLLNQRTTHFSKGRIMRCTTAINSNTSSQGSVYSLGVLSSLRRSQRVSTPQSISILLEYLVFKHLENPD